MSKVLFEEEGTTFAKRYNAKQDVTNEEAIEGLKKITKHAIRPLNMRYDQLDKLVRNTASNVRSKCFKDLHTKLLQDLNRVFTTFVAVGYKSPLHIQEYLADWIPNIEKLIEDTKKLNPIKTVSIDTNISNDNSQTPSTENTDPTPDATESM
jgi:fructose-1,6-bisphosphatase